MLNTSTNCMWCKVFLSTLEGMAHSWFNKIPKGSITSFRQVAILFRAQYMENIVRERMIGELMLVIQGSQESLREYISRFNLEASNILKLQQEVAVLAMMSGLRDRDFKSYLGRKSFTTLAEVLGKANEFIKREKSTEQLPEDMQLERVAKLTRLGKSPIGKNIQTEEIIISPRRTWEVRIKAGVMNSELKKKKRKIQ